VAFVVGQRNLIPNISHSQTATAARPPFSGILEFGLFASSPFADHFGKRTDCSQQFGLRGDLLHQFGVRVDSRHLGGIVSHEVHDDGPRLARSGRCGCYRMAQAVKSGPAGQARTVTPFPVSLVVARCVDLKAVASWHFLKKEKAHNSFQNRALGKLASPQGFEPRLKQPTVVDQPLTHFSSECIQ
jgi:hypothetical protein